MLILKNLNHKMNNIEIVTNFNLIKGQPIGVKCDYGPIKIWSGNFFKSYAPAYKTDGNLFKISSKYKLEDIDITDIVLIN